MSSVVGKTISKNDQLTYERAIDRVTLTQGKVLVTDQGDSTVLSGEQTYEAKGSADITLVALEPSQITVDFSGDPVIAPAFLQPEPSDTRSLEELQREARERQVPGYENLSRADLIASLERV